MGKRKESVLHEREEFHFLSMQKRGVELSWRVEWSGVLGFVGLLIVFLILKIILKFNVGKQQPTVCVYS